MNNLKIAFMGTPDFAAIALEALLQTRHEIVCVYSQPPRPKGRGHQVQQSPVHALAESYKIPVLTPKSLKTAEAQAEFAAQNVDVAVVAAYGLILPKAVLDAPKFGCLNIHASLLPRWRGASPIQRAIWEGDEKSGVTIMQMDEGLDTGGMIAHVETLITLRMSSSMLHDKLAQQGAELIVKVLDEMVVSGKQTAQKQDEALVTYAHLLKKEDGQIEWMQNAAQIDRQIRALTPWPGVYTDVNAARFKIHAAQIVGQGADVSAGTILDKQGHVSCGEGTVLQILKIQPAGKQAMDFASAVNGGYVKVGQIFT